MTTSQTTSHNATRFLHPRGIDVACDEARGIVWGSRQRRTHPIVEHGMNVHSKIESLQRNLHQFSRLIQTLPSGLFIGQAGCRVERRVT